MGVVQTREVVRLYAPGRGVAGISLSLAAGQCLALLGANGAGKSTLVRLLAGLERPQQGELEILGRRPLGRPVPGCAVLLERAAQWERLSGWQNAWFAARVQGLTARQAHSRLAELLAEADLAAEAARPVAGYSFGMRRKLALVQALVAEPLLLILDEPTAGVDAQYLIRLAARIARRTEQGRATLIAGNDPAWVEGVAQQVAILHQGRLKEHGPLQQVKARLAPLRSLALELANLPDLARPRLEGLVSFRQQGRTVQALLQREEALAPLLAEITRQGGLVRSLKIRGGTLADALLQAGEEQP